MSERPLDDLGRQNEAARKRAAKRDALMEERAKYERRGEQTRVTLVDAELKALAAEGRSEMVDEDEARERVRAEFAEKAKIEALIHERDGDEKRGLADRVELVNAELRRVAVEGKPPRKRASTR
jgi:hypothetical protein